MLPIVSSLTGHLPILKVLTAEPLTLRPSPVATRVTVAVPTLILFATLVGLNRDKAWKAWKHEDGEKCFGGGWFIVGIDTPDGSYTYHYEEKDWGLFDCEELPVAKPFDGHTDKDVERLLSLVKVNTNEEPYTDKMRWL